MNEMNNRDDRPDACGDADRPDPGYAENHPPAAPVLLPTGEHGGSYAVSNLYSFGDRLVDDGGAFSNAAAAEALGLPRPNASPLYFNGGFSDGPNWTANLAGLLGVPEDGRDDNFGYVLATARPIANPLDAFAAGSALNTFGGQIDAFEGAVGSFAPTDLVTVTFGGNDLTLPSGVSPEEGIALSVQAIVDGMARLAHLGAENFLVTNLPDLELAPLFQDPGFLAQLGAEPGDFVPLVAAFNARLASALDAFEHERGVDVDVADLNGLFGAIAADPLAYGFVNVNQPVLALPPLEPGTPEVFNPAIDGQDPAVRAETLFIDPFFHPTAPGQVLIAEAALDVLLA